jgi:hypothetical protein
MTMRLRIRPSYRRKTASEVLLLLAIFLCFLFAVLFTNIQYTSAVFEPSTLLRFLNPF